MIRYAGDVLDLMGLSGLSDEQRDMIARTISDNYLSAISDIGKIGYSRVEKLEMIDNLEDRLELLESARDGVDGVEFDTTEDLLELIDQHREKAMLSIYYQFLMNAFEFSLDWGK